MPDTILNLRRIYVKNSSFEIPDGPKVFKEQKPLENVNKIQINHAPLDDENLHEVTLTLEVTSKSGDKPVFVGKVIQAGIFKIENATQEQLDQIAYIHCSHMLYPYACNMLSQLVTSASFPALLMQPINFGQLYQQQEKQKKAEQEKAQQEETEQTVH